MGSVASVPMHNTSPEFVVFKNVGDQIQSGDKTPTQVNEFLDSIQFDPSWRFQWFKHEDNKVVYLSWVNGGWRESGK